MRSSLPVLQLAALVCAFLAPGPAFGAPEEHNVLDGLQCRCLPSQPCWPSSASWSKFNQTVGGRLISTYPVARECHGSFYDKTRCEDIKKGYFFDHWRQLQPGPVQHVNWETLGGKGCLGFNQTQPCDQGNVPLLTVNVSSVADIQATVSFASKHNLRLVIKNTGHDFLGRSTAANSLSLWTYFRKRIATTDNFIPEGAPKETKGEHAVVLESGALWKDVYLAVHQAGRIAVGGADPTVGAGGGFCSGGGHGVLSPMHGLCVDNVLQFTVVTADGQLRVANAYQNQDLFWALRGGGAGTFGVLVETVLRTHPALEQIHYAFALITSPDPTKIDMIASDFWARQVALGKAGFSGYCFVDSNLIMLQYYLLNAPFAQAQAGVRPWLDYARSLSNVTVMNDTITTYPDYYTLFRMAMPGPGEGNPNAGGNLIIASRLIPADLLESKEKSEEVSLTLSGISSSIKASLPAAIAHTPGPNGQYLMHLMAGGQVAAAAQQGHADKTSLLPAWRKALIHVVVTASWEDRTPLSQQRRIQRTLTTAMDRLRKLTPGSGAYTNEADPEEPRWQNAFWGKNYPRLRAIKRKYDPKGLFVCRLCVGSDDWSDDLNCPRRR
ncbi:hypothetical protein DFQ27_004393 [Actinomortierella ambigua]|uniref:FAD-binding PCMH-type domain-containing protein n=1 Tax=Actinomortierella ambigua TaxID=1343610 RepID=A0A9P6Q415_9FUNG|nr:hypothetical protein DFQ27_004393 [Actinomortierella ambigua]